jgi:SAM-dependent methyltransferase
MKATAILLERQLEARLESERTRLGNADLEDRVVDLVKSRGARRILDLGAGTGDLVERLGAAGIRASGLDLCGKMLARARRSAKQTPELLQGDMERLPVASLRLDLVTSVLVTHYLKEPGRAFSEAARILRPGGSFIVADRIASPDPRLREIQQRIESLRNPAVQRLLTSQELVETLGLAGFRVELVEFVEDTLPLDVWLAGVDGERTQRIRQQLLLAPAELGGLRFDAPERIRLRIDLILARKI